MTQTTNEAAPLGAVLSWIDDAELAAISSSIFWNHEEKEKERPCHFRNNNSDTLWVFCASGRRITTSTSRHSPNRFRPAWRRATTAIGFAITPRMFGSAGFALHALRDDRFTVFTPIRR